MTAYQRNLQLLNQLIALPKEELVKTINKSIPKQAMLNKYDNF